MAKIIIKIICAQPYLVIYLKKALQQLRIWVKSCEVLWQLYGPQMYWRRAIDENSDRCNEEAFKLESLPLEPLSFLQPLVCKCCNVEISYVVVPVPSGCWVPTHGTAARNRKTKEKSLDYIISWLSKVFAVPWVTTILTPTGNLELPISLMWVYLKCAMKKKEPMQRTQTPHKSPFSFFQKTWVKTCFCNEACHDKTQTGEPGGLWFPKRLITDLFHSIFKSPWIHTWICEQ